MCTKFPKIQKVKDVLKAVDDLDNPELPGLIPLTGTVKLHGMHADIVVHRNNRITLQSRNLLDLDLKNDVIGFAQFMHPLTKEILMLRDKYHARFKELNPGVEISPQYPLIIAGEFIGKGIQKKVAISDLSKRFVILTASINSTRLPDAEYSDIHIESAGIYNVYRAGSYTHTIDRNNLEASMETIQKLTMEVEKECPFAKTFGISGIGEGIVWKCLPPLPSNSEFWFKTKGPLHAQTEPVNKSAKHLAGKEKATVFANLIASKMRLEQGWNYLAETGVKQDKKATGAFLKWVVQDCEAEEKLEMKELDIKMELLRPEISKIAQKWFTGRVLEKEKDDGLAAKLEATSI
ncbi:MAG: hypothetical protein MMC33_009644 [Icmadophila ericetorum]|nr:hypothetical protein [Icmadophila ericetorum]